MVLGMVSRVLRQRLEGTTLGHWFLKSRTKRWRRIRRICPQLLDHDFCHSDLFLPSLSMSLQVAILASNPEILSMNCWYRCVKLTAAMFVTTTLPHAKFRDRDAPLP